MGGVTQSHHYDTSEAPGNQNPDWMSRLPDDTSLADVTIPGTHRSLSIYGGHMYQCQSWSLVNQYESGVRFVDIRCRHYENDLPLHYAHIFQNCYLKDVLRTTMEFLFFQPSETVLMRIKEEYIAAYNEMNFEETLLKIMSEYKEDSFYLKPEIPILGEVRGKIVIIQEFASTEPIGLPYYKRFKLEEESWVPTLFNMSSRWERTEQNLETASVDSDRGQQIYLTYCSGAGFGAYPYSVASYVNWYCAEYVKNKGKACLGIVAMDFPGAGLITDLINTNKLRSHMIVKPLPEAETVFQRENI